MTNERYGWHRNRECFRQWARERERLTINDVLDEAESRGYIKTNCGRCLQGVNDIRVRVDEVRFIPDEEVPFDVSPIDDALSRLVGKYAMPYEAFRVSDFARLPLVPGHTWNPYLLTSFCWRFSRKFEHLCFHTYPHPNIIGAMVRKECGYTRLYQEKAYERMLEDVVRDAGLLPDADVIDRWLMENHWICRYSGVGKRIEVRLKSVS